jgi:hypothetical protein
LTLEDRISNLSDSDAVNCLNRVLVGLELTDSTFRSVVSSKGDAVRQVIVAAAEQAEVTMPKLSDGSLANDGDATRQVLLEMVSRPELRQNVEGALHSNRPVLFDPITASLVLAGIVAVLSTDVTIKYEDGKLSVKIHKEKTPKEILGKFFGLFKAA